MKTHNLKLIKHIIFNVLILGFVFAQLQATAGASCQTPANPIEAENCLPGNLPAEWDVVGAGDLSIQGFTTDMSVNKGQTVSFKVKTNATNYRLDIYRLGYYGGNGARKVATVTPSAALPQTQPNCLEDGDTGLIDCGNWGISASWVVPTNAVSGIYFARAVRTDTGGASHIVFIVRDDAGGSDLLFQTSDSTWQAYNEYGGNDLYTGNPVGRSYKVSYNRPFLTRSSGSLPNGLSWLFAAEYPMVRWLEANGYNVSYFTDVDSDRYGTEILEHKAFLSVGHDEYWSAGQRANVEAARAQGVNLAFFSGNEVFWKTRWEPSIDGSGTPHRTLVSYKETKANAKIDPSASWTGTWRDPRFSPPADGGKPENALTGQIFTVNCCSPQSNEVNIVVPESYGKHRFWRNTSIANLSPGQSATLPKGILGFEWDEALDNGHQPAGLMKMSSTTVNVPSYLLDYGSTYGSGTATHSLTLYRHGSGALVFGAGTVRWSWGLDVHHDADPLTPNATTVPDVRIQQATVNLFADMGVQPKTLQPGLIATGQSADVSRPVSTITSPLAGASVQSGELTSISGTASDIGGVVASVEVSTDGGATWHLATGQTNWTYSWSPGALGFTTIKSRAVDDSGNQEIAGSGVTVTVTTPQPQTCPCTIWASGATPVNTADPDTGAVELGVKFKSDVAGTVTGVRFYKGVGNTGAHVGHVWTSTGTLLGTVAFTGETATGWQQANFSSPVAIAANTVYVVSYLAPNGHYAGDGGYFANAGVDRAPLHALQNGVSGGNGVYVYGASGGFPSNPSNSANYWVDVVFSDTAAPGDTTPPTVSGNTPSAGATGVGTGTTVTATFNEAMNASTISGLTFELRGSGNALVPASVTYSGNTATLTPNVALSASTLYTATVIGGSGGVKDLAGNALASNHSWSFTTGAVTPQGCPCTIWPSTATPVNTADPDTGAVELGVKFKSDVAGTVTGVRFYKGVGNTGAHVGHLWTSTGTLLGTVAFTGETATGWQQANFTSPVAIAANTVYVVSYLAPNGHYAGDGGYFANAGVDRAPLHALQNGVSGGNGLYVYGASGGFPSNTFNSANYWVDVVFSDTAAPGDTTPPTVSGNTPSAGATGVGTGTTVTATFNEAMNASTISGLTFELRGSGNALVPASVTYSGNTATLTPNVALSASTLYTATVIGGSGGVKDLAGNALASNHSWSFTTGAVTPQGCPCTIWPSTATPVNTADPDTGAVELGVKFKSDVAGTVTGVRFYKGVGNTGAHVGHLWTSTGTLLGTVAFTGETATGWQQANFTSPVAIAANTVYVVSYLAPNGHYAGDGGYFANAGVDRAPLHALQNGVSGGNGLYVYGASGGFPSNTFNSANYWVDVVFSDTAAPGDTTPPTVSGNTPSAGATGVGTGTTVTATFNEAMNASTISGLTFELRGSGNALVPASVTYSGNTATLTPNVALSASTLYTATVIGGSGGVKDLAGNALASNHSWSFTTGAVTPQGCPCTIWPSTATPVNTADPDTGAVELGVKFKSDVAGTVIGVRFYKGVGNTGAHVGHLWTSTGTLLGTVAFTGETATGWQQANFTSPVAIAANTVYVVSYLAPNGHYAGDGGYFANAGVDRAPLHALQNGVSGGNGLYVYGASGGFPSNTFNSANYWVDVVFSVQ